MLKILYAAWLGLSVVISTQFALDFNVQGHPRSLLSVAIESSISPYRLTVSD